MCQNSVFQFFVLYIMLIYSVLYCSLIRTLFCRHFGVSEYHAHSREVGVALFHTRAMLFSRNSGQVFTPAVLAERACRPSVHSFMSTPRPMTRLERVNESLIFIDALACTLS